MKYFKVIKGNNHEVIDYYYEIIEQSLLKCGYAKKDGRVRSDFFVIGEALTFIFYHIFYRKPIIYWSQGLGPEESFMRHHSKFRLNILSFIEKYALVHAKFLFFVSDYQKVFYEEKYNIRFKKDNFIVMPCFNSVFNEEAFTNDKYKNNVFCYVGSLAIWQCFEQTISLYKEIEEQFAESGVQLKVFTRQIDEAQKIISAYGIRKYSIQYKEGTELSEELSACKFGFVLRENTAVNSIATPTKFGNYLGNGIIPIYSDCLYGARQYLKEIKYAIEVPSQYRIPLSIFEPYLLPLDSNSVKEDYKNVFDKYFNVDVYVALISKQVNKISI